MPTLKMIRYFKGVNTEHEFYLQRHVTITGKEDHFQLAYKDADMFVNGLVEADKVTDFGKSDKPIWRIHSIVMN